MGILLADNKKRYNLKLYLYIFLATHRDNCLGINTSETTRAILILVELNLSGNLNNSSGFILFKSLLSYCLIVVC